jgi:hypothetical protein
MQSECSNWLLVKVAILDEGCVGHNYMWFTEEAIDIAGDDEDWGALARYASRLRNYTQKQPLDFADFLIGKAETVSKMGRLRRAFHLYEPIWVSGFLLALC